MYEYKFEWTVLDKPVKGTPEYKYFAEDHWNPLPDIVNSTKRWRSLVMADKSMIDDIKNRNWWELQEKDPLAEYSNGSIRKVPKTGLVKCSFTCYSALPRGAFSLTIKEAADYLADEGCGYDQWHSLIKRGRLLVTDDKGVLPHGCTHIWQQVGEVYPVGEELLSKHICTQGCESEQFRPVHINR